MMDYSYIDRFISEYRQLCNRLDKLHRMIIRYAAGTLDFEPDCSIDILMCQEKVMSEYKRILEIRAQIEKIDLDDLCEGDG